MEPTVRDVPEAGRYEIRDGEQLLGHADYQRDGDTVVFIHTEVDQDSGRVGPRRHAGAGRAGRRPCPGRFGRGAVLVRARLDRAAPRVRRPPGVLGVVTATRREPAATVVPAPDDHVLGDPLAPVTVVEYGDYECPYCAAAAPVLRRLVEESDGQVRLVFRNFPLADRHPYALTAALAAEAAGAQGAFWPMHDLLFARQERLDDASLRAYAAELGLDGDRVVGEAAQPFGDKVEQDFATGLAAGVGGTPTVFIDGRLFDGRMELGAPAPRRLRRGRRAGPRGAGGNDGGPSASGEHSEKRPPRTRSRTTPATAAITDPARMPIVACSCSRSSSNARSVMNNEIVKPIPASVAPAIRCDQRTPPGRMPQPVRSANAVPAVMPMVFPTTRAATIPRVTGEVAAVRRVSGSSGTPALARPNTGTTT